MKAYSFTGIEPGEANATSSSKDVDQDPYQKDWFVHRVRAGTWCTPLEPWMLDFYPKNVLIDNKQFKTLTPWVIYAAHWSVCQRVKDIIEGLEPGMHQFIPATVMYGNKNSSEAHKYYTLQVNSMCNDVDVEKSDVSWSELPDGIRYWIKQPLVPVSLPIESIRGKHVWRNEKARIWMMSGELHDALQREGLAMGLKFQEQVVV